MRPAPEFGEVLQRERDEYTTGLLFASGSWGDMCVRGLVGSIALGVRDGSRGVRLCFEATEAGLRAEVIDD